MSGETSNFDFVVVGAGAAGCVVAARLSENPNWRVLLLEEGPDDKSLFIKANGGFFKTHGTKRTFLFETEPEPLAGGRRIPLLQGRTLGGGTSVNAMCYVRGQAEDYDDWAELGLTDWSYEKVLPYFIKAEDNERLANRFHGSDGPMMVSDPVYQHPLNRAFIRAAQQTTVQGRNEPIEFNDDFNGAHQDGVGYYQQMSRNGERSSTARSFLAKALRENKNLTVRTDARVRRVVVKDGRAVGVEVDRQDGSTEVIGAGREVVLSAGTFMTPKILLLSGIGPADEVRKHGIDVVRNSPNVGRNYQDHMLAPVDMRLKDPISFVGQDKGLNALRNGLQWLLFRTGPLASNVCEAGGFIDIDGDGRPEIQLNAIPVATSAWGEDASQEHCFALSPCLLTCHSRGTVTLRSADPKDMPVVHGNFMHEKDVESLVDGVELSRRILAAPAMAKFTESEVLPGPDVGTSRDALRRYVIENCKTALHPTSTCAMGTGDDAATDGRLRLRGVEGLRVADGSVMPKLVRGNTTAPIVMIGERAADFIKADHAGS